ncbi:MAG: MltA domain-containing protein [Elusimicrobia bacterium]|nr:MltA domain-containing protein [Elusimicrobiota bacterium]
MKKPVLLALTLFLAGCATIDMEKQGTAGTGDCPPCPQVCVATAPAAAIPVIPVETDKTPSFLDQDDKKALMKAAELNLKYFQSGGGSAISYTFGSRKITAGTLAASTSEFIKILALSPDQAELDRKIKETFDIYRLAGRDSTGTVIFSSYYEPTLPASLTKTGDYKYPIYARPDDLISVNLEDFNDKFKGEKLTGRLNRNALVPYMAREEIDFEEALNGKGLELAWFKDRADIMDLHIEGSGRLKLEDGRQIKAKFAATNSLKFKGWLAALVESGALPREGLTHEKGKQYLLEHPDKERSIMSQNRRYTFFKLEQPADPQEGPTGTYGLPLVGWRSVAVDNALVPLGALAFMSVNTPDVNEQGVLLGRKQDSRFVFCQDTGGAIKGPGRVDFFAGNGAKARTFAFKLWDQGALYLLALKEKPVTLARAAQFTLTGLDMLERDDFAPLKGKRVGLITNHSAVDKDGKNAIDALHGSGKVELAAIFSPEHGFRGAEEGGALIDNSTDPATGISVYSLYGKNQRPTADMLKGLDVLVFDIQDIGARFYTYLTTMGYAMEEAAKNNLEFMVLDRPNPIGGDIIEGPALAPDVSAFTAYLSVPVRHAFTAGEMALFHKDFKKLDLKLTVVKMENWRREMFFDETAVVWTNPSPNIRNVAAEILYPGLGCFEATNVSVGRGTDAPFLWFGAPWMKAEKIAKKLSKARLLGVKFSYAERTPSKDAYEGKLSKGVAIEITRAALVRPLEIFVHAAYYLREYNSKDFIVKAAEIKKAIFRS